MPTTVSPIVAASRGPWERKIYIVCPYGWRLIAAGLAKLRSILEGDGRDWFVACENGIAWTDGDDADLVEAALDEIAAGLLERRRLDVQEVKAPVDDLPRATPRTICGVFLDEIAAGKFEQAVAAGELLIGLDLPIASPLPDAWERWCRQQGLPHRVREERP